MSDLDKEFYGLSGLIIHDVSDVLPLAETNTKWREFVGDIEEIFEIMGKGTYADGTPVKVGVGDTGLSAQHLEKGGDLEGSELRNFTNDRSPYDAHSHGSHVSCMIAGQEQGSGIVGLAPEAKVYHAKVLSDSGSGTTRGILNGVRWLGDQGCKVINLSLGGGGFSSEAEAVYRDLSDRGILVFCSTGNDGHAGSAERGGFPARYDSTASVGAIDFDKSAARFTSRSASCSITGAGVNIWSCGARGYTSMSGTSMSCPYVVGNAVRHIGYFDRLGIKVKNLAHYFELVAPAIEDLGREGRDDIFGRGLIIDRALINHYGNPADKKPDPVTPEPVDPKPIPVDPKDPIDCDHDTIFQMNFFGTTYGLIRIDGEKNLLSDSEINLLIKEMYLKS